MYNYENRTLKNRIIAIISNYSQDMENDSCLDANFGVPEDNFEDIANDLIKEFNIMFKTTKVA